MEQSLVPKDAADADAGFEHLRSEPRDSMFLMAVVRRQGGPDVTVKVRNLSAGGMMAESPVSFSRGDLVEIDLRGIGVISGRIAWTTAGRIGTQFDSPIDPRLARKPVGSSPQPQLVKPSRSMWRPSLR
ncbi:MAG TPA: PilZ domain-containing protein [Sphingomonas sp.]|nr:PilZ domain-containing protein [Sphingomonas sp.]